MKAKLLFTGLLLCTGLTTIRAQNVALATWNMATTVTTSNVSPWNATSTNANVTVGGLTRGPGISIITSGSVTGWGATGWNYTDGTLPPSQTAATAVANGKYMTFSITANAGNTVSLSSISPYNIRTSPSAGAIPLTGIWQYSLDTTNFTNIGAAISWGQFGPIAGTVFPAIDLSTIHDLQGVAAGITITIRLVLWNGKGFGYWAFNGGTSPNTALVVNGTTAVALPLNLLSFTGKKEDGVNRLDWVTAHEKNVSQFDIERSNDGNSFNKIAEIKATNNDGGTNNNYSYEDKTYSATSYYRLRMLDMDGSFHYSNTVVLLNKALTGNIKLYPNPAQSTMLLEGLQGKAFYRITNAIGGTIYSTAIDAQAGYVATIDVAVLAPGVYFLHYQDEVGSETIRFVKE